MCHMKARDAGIRCTEHENCTCFCMQRSPTATTPSVVAPGEIVVFHVADDLLETFYTTFDGPLDLASLN